jgi:hypothetical protein
MTAQEIMDRATNYVGRPALDERDAEIISARLAAMDAREGPRVGDFVRFACGTLRRISHDWGDGVQTSDAGSFYLGDYGCSFSGALFGTVPTDSLTLAHLDSGWSPETRAGAVWVFHHDHHCAHNGVHASIPFRVYVCDREAPR